MICTAGRGRGDTEPKCSASGTHAHSIPLHCLPGLVTVSSSSFMLCAQHTHQSAERVPCSPSLPGSPGRPSSPWSGTTRTLPGVSFWPTSHLACVRVGMPAVAGDATWVLNCKHVFKHSSWKYFSYRYIESRCRRLCEIMVQL